MQRYELPLDPEEWPGTDEHAELVDLRRRTRALKMRCVTMRGTVIEILDLRDASRPSSPSR